MNKTVSLDRRSLVKGAAWSLPALASVTAIPAASASLVRFCDPFVAPAPPGGLNASEEKVSTTFQVPPHVNIIEYEVAGGAGGSIDGAETWSGDVVRGHINVSPGDILTLVVGQGGTKRPDASINTPGIYIPGGRGFGNGGDSDGRTCVSSAAPCVPLTARRIYYPQSGSGGGGSAILLNSEVAVVAGGGHGQGRFWSVDSSRISGRWNASRIDGHARWSHSALNIWIETSPGHHADGHIPGAAGESGAVLGTRSTRVLTQETMAGSSGMPPESAGGNGANSDSYWINSSKASMGIFVTSAAGGGGYAGGGSSSVTQAVFETRTGETVIASNSDNGGRGSSFVSPNIFGEIFSRAAKNATKELQRGPGYITLTWTC